MPGDDFQIHDRSRDAEGGGHGSFQFYELKEAYQKSTIMPIKAVDDPLKLLKNLDGFFSRDINYDRDAQLPYKMHVLSRSGPMGGIVKGVRQYIFNAEDNAGFVHKIAAELFYEKLFALHESFYGSMPLPNVRLYGTQAYVIDNMHPSKQTFLSPEYRTIMKLTPRFWKEFHNELEILQIGLKGKKHKITVYDKIDGEFIFPDTSTGLVERREYIARMIKNGHLDYSKEQIEAFLSTVDKDKTVIHNPSPQNSDNDRNKTTIGKMTDAMARMGDAFLDREESEKDMDMIHLGDAPRTFESWLTPKLEKLENALPLMVSDIYPDADTVKIFFKVDADQLSEDIDANAIRNNITSVLNAYLFEKGKIDWGRHGISVRNDEKGGYGFVIESDKTTQTRPRLTEIFDVIDVVTQKQIKMASHFLNDDVERLQKATGYQCDLIEMGENLAIQFLVPEQDVRAHKNRPDPLELLGLPVLEDAVDGVYESGTLRHPPKGYEGFAIVLEKDKERAFSAKSYLDAYRDTVYNNFFDIKDGKYVAVDDKDRSISDFFFCMRYFREAHNRPRILRDGDTAIYEGDWHFALDENYSLVNIKAQIIDEISKRSGVDSERFDSVISTEKLVKTSVVEHEDKDDQIVKIPLTGLVISPQVLKSDKEATQAIKEHFKSVIEHVTHLNQDRSVMAIESKTHRLYKAWKHFSPKVKYVPKGDNYDDVYVHVALNHENDSNFTDLFKKVFERNYYDITGQGQADEFNLNSVLDIPVNDNVISKNSFKFPASWMENKSFFHGLGEDKKQTVIQGTVDDLTDLLKDNGLHVVSVTEGNNTHSKVEYIQSKPFLRKDKRPPVQDVMQNMINKI